MNKNTWQAIKFTLFSISAGLIQIVSFELLNILTPLDYWIKYLTALILSILWNYTFNRRYTFHSNANIASSMILVFIFYVFFTPVSTFLGQVASNNNINETVVLLVTMIANFILEFLYQRFFVFKNSIDTNSIANKNE